MNTNDSDPLTFREVTRDTWPDFERLFESKGGPGYCWCMAWRATSAELKVTSRPNRKLQIARRVGAGTPVGILGYLNSEPVAWCSIAPRSTFRGLVRDGTPDDGIWSITCFFVSRQHRKGNVAASMLQAAVQHAKQHGARLVEGYPVDPDSPSYRHMGYVSMFSTAGFSERGRVGTRRHIVQLSVEQ